MYRDYFALSEKPFNLTPDPDFLYLSRSHKEALAHLTYGVESKSGFVMVTGEVGSGKTTLLRTLVGGLGPSVLMSQVTNTRVSYKELLELILQDFGVNPAGLGKTSLLSALNDFLIEKYREGRNCVLIVDEAQNLGVPTLEGVRMLSNLETQKAKLLHTVLVGQPGLRDLIESPELEQLRQRITVRYHLGALSAGEVGEYIHHRLAKVITDPEKAPVIPDEVVPLIHGATGGLPRLINVLCDAALLHAYVAESRVIGEGIVAEVAEQIARDQKGRPEPVPATPAPEDAGIRARVHEIESRLNAMMTDAARGEAGLASPGRLTDKASQLTKREKELRSLEEALAGRVAELDRREAELNDRVSQLKAEWRKRMEQLERARQQVLGGGGRFPGLRVHAYDPDPRIQNLLADVFSAHQIDAEIHGDFEAFLIGLREGNRAGWFSVALLGAEQDDAANVARVAALSREMAHVPRIYLSDLDLSTLRRKILAAGANYFLEKPNGRAGSFTSHKEAMEHLKADVLRVVEGVQRQYRAFFETFVGEQDPES